MRLTISQALAKIVIQALQEDYSYLNEIKKTAKIEYEGCVPVINEEVFE